MSLKSLNIEENELQLNNSNSVLQPFFTCPTSEDCTLSNSVLELSWISGLDLKTHLVVRDILSGRTLFEEWGLECLHYKVRGLREGRLYQISICSVERSGKTSEWNQRVVSIL